MRAILAAAQTKPELRVVDDQRGAPTSSEAIADAVARILADSAALRKPGGVYHLSAAGETTWYGFAKELLSMTGLKTPVTAVSTAEFGAPARRPKSSLLDNAKLLHTFGVALAGWRAGLPGLSRKIEIQ